LWELVPICKQPSMRFEHGKRSLLKFETCGTNKGRYEGMIFEIEANKLTARMITALRRNRQKMTLL
jgi:hypothetical protein